MAAPSRLSRVSRRATPWYLIRPTRWLAARRCEAAATPPQLPEVPANDTQWSRNRRGSGKPARRLYGWTQVQSPRCPAHSGLQGGRRLEGSESQRSGSARTLVGDLRRRRTQRTRRTGAWRQPNSEGTGGPFPRGARSHAIQPRFGISHHFYSSIDRFDSRFGESSLSAGRGRPSDWRFRLAI